MSAVYLLVYSDTCGSREFVKRWVNSKPLITTWRYDLPNSFYLVSDSDVNVLTAELRKHCGSKGRFLITKLEKDRNGFLPKETWAFIKKHSGGNDSPLLG